MGILLSPMYFCCRNSICSLRNAILHITVRARWLGLSVIQTISCSHQATFLMISNMFADTSLSSFPKKKIMTYLQKWDSYNKSRSPGCWLARLCILLLSGFCFVTSSIHIYKGYVFYQLVLLKIWIKNHSSEWKEAWITLNWSF